MAASHVSATSPDIPVTFASKFMGESGTLGSEILNVDESVKP